MSGLMHQHWQQRLVFDFRRQHLRRSEADCLPDTAGKSVHRQDHLDDDVAAGRAVGFCDSGVHEKSEAGAWSDRFDACDPRDENILYDDRLDKRPAFQLGHVVSPPAKFRQSASYAQNLGGRASRNRHMGSVGRSISRCGAGRGFRHKAYVEALTSSDYQHTTSHVASDTAATGTASAAVTSAAKMSAVVGVIGIDPNSKNHGWRQVRTQLSCRHPLVTPTRGARPACCVLCGEQRSCVHLRLSRGNRQRTGAAHLPQMNSQTANLPLMTVNGFHKRHSACCRVNRGRFYISRPDLAMNGFASDTRQGTSNRQPISFARFCGPRMVGNGSQQSWKAAKPIGGATTKTFSAGLICSLASPKSQSGSEAA